MLQSYRNYHLPVSPPACPVENRRCPPRVTAIDPDHPDRRQVETFISDGFASNHGSMIRSFMPCLLTLGDSRIRASLGVRPATQSLFLEQYLDHPIECMAPELALPREQIAEIGNLASQSRNYTLRLLMVTIIVLHRSGFRKVVFCATRKVASILRCSGVTPTPIIKADGHRLGTTLSEWGRYYELQPTLMYLDVISVVEMIESSSLLMQQYLAVDPDIDFIVSIIKKVS